MIRLEKCYNFALECYKTNKDEYAKRNQNCEQVIIDQIAQGKYAELLVQDVLKENQYQIIKPVDFNIYKAKDKSFDCDIKAFKLQHMFQSNDFNFHVKSISYDSANKYGASWLFQKWDPLLKSPKNTDKVVFVLLDESGLDYIQMICIDAKAIIKHLKEPKLEYLRINKCAVYMEDIE